jgi:thiol:disulfide interchange protein
MKPIVDRLEESYGNEFNIVRIDVTRPRGEKAARDMGLVGQPYYVFFGSDNEESRRMGGPQTHEVLAQEIELTLERDRELWGRSAR